MTTDLNRRLLLLAGCAAPFAAGLAFAAVPADGSRPGKFMIGADVTWIAEDEAAGAEYYLAGVRTDP